MAIAPPSLDAMRFEVLPFTRAESEAAAVDRPLTLTLTCSPRHGIDASVDVACQLRRLGHAVVLHLAARMVRGPEHLDELLERMAAAGIADLFVIAGDAKEPVGEYASGLDVIPALRAHPRAPRSIGVPAYPEGHPLIDADTLADALAQKARYADYMVSQICFDPDALLGWLETTRSAGVQLPLYVGVPGTVDRRRLLEISLRVGVGGSIRFVRKQRGLRQLFGGSGHATERVLEATEPLVARGEQGIAGFHFFTFNQLVDTVRLVDRRLADRVPAGVDSLRRASRRP